MYTQRERIEKYYERIFLIPSGLLIDSSLATPVKVEKTRLAIKDGTEMALESVSDLCPS
jgi:hypothetical protein